LNIQIKEILKMVMQSKRMKQINLQNRNRDVHPMVQTSPKNQTYSEKQKLFKIYLFRKEELNSARMVSLDHNLLTGNLEQDLRILNLRT
tara:strand:- start:96 stop:362 length:267 start_codon:yes stop_codon:yes gene_type:complete